MSLAAVAMALYAWMVVTLVANLRDVRRQPRERQAQRVGISVLIPARNEAENLKRLLPSLLDQTHPDFEVIVVDDGSEDETSAVVKSFVDDRIRLLSIAGPPTGWMGKVYALYVAVQQATKPLFLFVDADAAFGHPRALEQLEDRHAALDSRAVLSGYTRLRGGGELLVSLIPFAFLTVLPWPLARRLPFASMAALNGQLWMIRRDQYLDLQPHLNNRGEILEDVQIARYLKARGIAAHLVDVQDDVSVWMYPDLRAARRGFRKNAYLLLGGRAWLVIPILALWLILVVVAPMAWPWLLLPLLGMKWVSDRFGRFPLHISLLAPVSLLAAAGIVVDSMIAHWTGRVTWKGRRL